MRRKGRQKIPTCPHFGLIGEFCRKSGFWVRALLSPVAAFCFTDILFDMFSPSQIKDLRCFWP